MEKSKALRLIAESTFRPFTKGDADAFSGVESDNPLICDSREDYLIVLDGAWAEFLPIVEGDADQAGAVSICFE